jgi:nicotinamide-nucleotide amidase
MNASVIAVGTELLFGQVVNTNAAYLSRELQTLGANVLYHYTVGDNPARMRETLELALAETDLVITSGGLGPTQDDLTKEIVAETLGARLVVDERALAEIEGFFNQLGRGMTDNNRKQALAPEGATVFYNPRGTAPGFALEKGGKTVIALPGPPSGPATPVTEMPRSVPAASRTPFAIATATSSDTAPYVSMSREPMPSSDVLASLLYVT